MNSTNQAAEIKNIWKIIATGPESIIELRAIKPDGIIRKLFNGKNYSSVDELRLAFEKQALKFNAKGYNIYVVMNPIKESFVGGSASDNDIAYRNLFLIDIDRHDSKNPANDIELRAAEKLADDVAAYLKEGGWDDPADDVDAQ
jgi:hypothetical protein